MVVWVGVSGGVGLGVADRRVVSVAVRSVVVARVATKVQRAAVLLMDRWWRAGPSGRNSWPGVSGHAPGCAPVDS